MREPTASDLPHRRVIHSLDGMRGLAALWVVAFHCPIPIRLHVLSGYLAVDIFFVLSGFVIAKTYLPKIASVKDVWPFMLRRIGRLYPMMMVGLVCMLAVLNTPLGRIADGGEVSAHAGLYFPVGQVLASLTFVSSLGFYHRLILNGPMWSVSVEFYTYIFFAAFAIWARRSEHFSSRHKGTTDTQRGFSGKESHTGPIPAPHSSRRSALAALISVLAAYALCVYGTVHVHQCVSGHNCMNVTYDFGIFRCITGFFLGYLAYEQAKSFEIMRVAAHPATQAVLAVASLPYVFLSFRIPALALSAPFFIFLMVLSVCADTGPLSRFFSWRPFLWLGHASYSIYVLDGPVQRLMWGIYNRPHAPAVPILLAAYFGALLLLAWCANRWIEDPARHWFATLSRSTAVKRGSAAVAPPV